MVSEPEKNGVIITIDKHEIKQPTPILIEKSIDALVGDGVRCLRELDSCCKWSGICTRAAG
jgi:hypothetical protein